jgi:hypothetical protein
MLLVVCIAIFFLFLKEINNTLMKTKLLFSFLFTSVAALAQSIPGFYSPIAPAVNYDVVTSSASLNEAAAGANISWNFNSLATVGTSVTQTWASTTAQFPNTTAMVRTTTTIDGQDNVNDIFLALPASGASITGISFIEVTLNYNTNNLLVGAFPLSYGHNTTDTVSGTFVGLGATGTFTGTAIVQVDAYGSFTANVGGIPANTTVTRLKVTQNLTFSSGPIPLGTATQTIYSYYSSQSVTDPVFRSTTTTLNLPLVNINDTTISHEILSATLGTGQFAVSKTVIAPNPVVDVLHFSGDTTVTGVIVTDLSGRIVLQSKAANDISVSHLSAGIYNVAIQSAAGTTLQKMVKQ